MTLREWAPTIGAIATAVIAVFWIEGSVERNIDRAEANLTERIDLNTGLIRDLGAEVRRNREEMTAQIVDLHRMSHDRMDMTSLDADTLNREWRRVEWIIVPRDEWDTIRASLSEADSETPAE